VVQQPLQFIKFVLRTNIFNKQITFRIEIFLRSKNGKTGFWPKRIEYILEWNLLEKKCKTAILLYCFHTAGVLYIFALYNLLGPGTSFYRKSKTNIKKEPNYEIGWFHNWPMIISHRLYAFHFTNDDFPL